MQGHFLAVANLALLIAQITHWCDLYLDFMV
jgi:hypothetical protein